MDVQAATMNIPRTAARESFRVYRQALREHRATRDDKMLYRGLRALLRGQQVIDINLAIAGGGVDAKTRPHLAVCRADSEWCHCWVNGDHLTFTTRQGSWGRRPRGEVQMPLTAFGGALAPARGLHCTAKLPVIPPQFRPAGDVSAFHLLWEAQWQPIPPVDPMLIQHVDGPFFVVLAAWDLSPLEQAVLRHRL